MNCQTCQRGLSALIDGETSERGGRTIKEHLSGCPVCRLELAHLLTLGEALNLAPGIEPSRAMYSALKIAIRAHQSALPRFQWRRRWLPALSPIRIGLVGVGLCLGILVGLLTNGAQSLKTVPRETDNAGVYAEPFEILPPDSPGDRYLALMVERGADE